MKNLYTFKILLLTFFWLYNTIYLSGQKKVNIIAGIGFPELIHVGARYQSGQSQLGGSIGYGDNSVYAFTGDYLYHFGKMSELSTRKKWYGRLGLSYLRAEDEYDIFKTLVLHTRIGKELNISRVLGFGVDAGLAFRIFEEETEIKSGPGWDINFDFGILEYVFPTLGLHIFYKL